MALSIKQLEEIVVELLRRPKHEKVRVLVSKLLTDGLGAQSADLTFEEHTIEVRGRIDALLGRTVIEFKSEGGVFRRKITLSADGKTITKFVTQTRGDGQQSEDTVVFDKQ